MSSLFALCFLLFALTTVAPAQTEIWTKITATPGAGYSQRMDTADFLADLERQRIHSAEPVPVYARGAGTYGATGALERTPVAVPIQTSQSVRRPPVDRPRPTYDDTDLEIPSFLRRPPQEEQG